jgi:RluA family pseudouridine synthase
VPGAKRGPGKAGAGDRQVDILFKDKRLLIVNKWPGILACGKRSVEELLRAKLNSSSLAAVHRLDKDTSGCIIYAMDENARDRMMSMFRKREIEKEYQAIAERKLNARNRKITRTLSGRRAVTRLTIIDANSKASYVKVNIETGRTHQIRKHLAGIGHPVVGDRAYGSARQSIDEVKRATRQMLHASRVSFEHPFTGQRVKVTAPLPEDFRSCLKMLKLG